MPLLTTIACVTVPASSLAQSAWRIDAGGEVLSLQTSIAALELSGLAYNPDSDNFRAVSDKASILFTLGLSGPPGNHFLRVLETTQLTDKKGRNLSNGYDWEGITLLPNNQLLLSSEGQRALFVFAPNGTQLRRFRASHQPDSRIFTQGSSNKGWEGLTSNQSSIWVVNESELRADKAPSTPAQPTPPRYTRIMQMSRGFGVQAHWAYPIAASDGLLNSYGISAMEVLPDGSFLVLERVVKFSIGSMGPALYHEIYHVEPGRLEPDEKTFGQASQSPYAPASNVMRLNSLRNGGFRPMSKQRLWSGVYTRHNFEGLAVGAKNTDGSRQLLLIADNGQGLAQGGLVLTLRRSH